MEVATLPALDLVPIVTPRVDWTVPVVCATDADDDVLDLPPAPNLSRRRSAWFTYPVPTAVEPKGIEGVPIGYGVLEPLTPPVPAEAELLSLNRRSFSSRDSFSNRRSSASSLIAKPESD